MSKAAKKADLKKVVDNDAPAVDTAPTPKPEKVKRKVHLNNWIDRIGVSGSDAFCLASSAVAAFYGFDYRLLTDGVRANRPVSKEEQDEQLVYEKGGNTHEKMKDAAKFFMENEDFLVLTAQEIKQMLSKGANVQKTTSIFLTSAFSTVEPSATVLVASTDSELQSHTEEETLMLLREYPNQRRIQVGLSSASFVVRMIEDMANQMGLDLYLKYREAPGRVTLAIVRGS